MWITEISVVHLAAVHCLLPVCVYQRDESIRSLCHHHPSFPSASPQKKQKKTVNTQPPPVWDRDPSPQCPLGDEVLLMFLCPSHIPCCFLAERRRSRRTSSGERVWPDPGHLLRGGSPKHSAGEVQLTVGHLFSTVVSCLHANRVGWCQNGTVKNVNMLYIECDKAAVTLVKSMGLRWKLILTNDFTGLIRNMEICIFTFLYQNTLSLLDF